MMATPGSRSTDSGSTIRDRAHHVAGQVVDKVQETASRIVGSGQQTGAPQEGQNTGPSGSVIDQATEQISEQVTSRLDMGKEYLVETVTGVAQALRQTGQHLRAEGSQPMLAGYADRGAEQLERFGGHMRQRDANELIAEVEWFARRQPMVFAGGAFALGMLAVRFLRSSGRQARPTSRSYGATPSGQSFSSAASTVPRTTGGTMTPPASTVPGGYAGPGASTPSGAPSTLPAAPTSMPRSVTGAGSGTGTGTPTAPRTGATTPGVTPSAPSERPTPRPAATPSVGGTTGSPGTTAPRSGAGTGSGGQAGGGSSSTGSDSRTQP